jgi:hypothetical protein
MPGLAGHMRRLAEDSSCPLPLADMVYNDLLAVKAAGRGDLDWVRPCCLQAFRHSTLAHLRELLACMGSSNLQAKTAGRGDWGVPRCLPSLPGTAA